MMAETGELDNLFGFLPRVSTAALRHAQADIEDGLFEEVAFLGLLDGAEVGPEQPDTVLLQYPAFRQNRRIEAPARPASAAGYQAFPANRLSTTPA
jgi:hypothetical protein